MSVLIIYASTYGNTKQVAEAIASVCGPDVHLVSAEDVTGEALRGISVLIVGSPTQGGRPTAAVQKFLMSLSPGSLTNIRVAGFDTRFDEKIQGFGLRLLMKTIKYAAEKISSTLVSKGGTLASEPAGFIVTRKQGPLKSGEIERAKQWASTIIQ
jgi:flavodoxin I